MDRLTRTDAGVDQLTQTILQTKMGLEEQDYYRHKIAMGEKKGGREREKERNASWPGLQAQFSPGVPKGDQVLTSRTYSGEILNEESAIHEEIVL